MKCPLFGMYDHERKGNAVAVAPDCLEGECAWWDEDDERCAFRSLVGELRVIMVHLGEIYRKMPHPGILAE